MTTLTPSSPGNPGRTPPLADGLPLIGSLLPMMNDMEGFLYRQYAKHGPCFRIKVLKQEMIVLGGPQAAEAMARNTGEFDAWQVWENIIKEFGGRQVMTMLEGKNHQRTRAAARKGFAKTRVQENIPLILQLVREAVHEHPPGQPFHALPFAQKLVANCIGTLTLGRKPDQHLQEIITYWHTQMAVNLSNIKPPSHLRKTQYLNAKAKVRAVAQDILNTDEQHFPSPYVHDLKQLVQEEPEIMNQEELLFMMVLPFVAGLDTVVNVLTLALYETLRRPELHARLKEEAAPLLAAGLPAQRLRELKTLHALVLETMRYYPIANMLPRHATQDFEFQGHHIHTGQRLMLALMASQRDPNLFKNPHEFDVERFLEPRNEHKQKNALNPYGAGAHTCLGAGMAEVLLAVLIPSIVNENVALSPPNYRMKPFHMSQVNTDSNLKFVRQ